MISFTVALKNGTFTSVEELKTIRILTRDGFDEYDTSHVDDVPLHENAPYIFIGNDVTLSVSGSDILYIVFSKD